MVEPSDAIINKDRPVVQDSEKEDHVELVLPTTGATIVMHHELFMSLFAEGMRIITGESVEEYR